MDRENMQVGTIDTTVRTLQIIVMALAAGVFTFGLVMVLRPDGGLKPLDPQAIVSIVMAAVSLLLIPSRLIVPAMVLRSGRQRIARGSEPVVTRRSAETHMPDSEQAKLLMLLHTTTIIGAALLEAAAFANLTGFMLEGQVYSLVLAALMLLGILLAIPTRNRVDAWLDVQSRRVQEVRQMAGLR
jgi:hypothetical protein